MELFFDGFTEFFNSKALGGIAAYVLIVGGVVGAFLVPVLFVLRKVQ